MASKIDPRQWNRLFARTAETGWPLQTRIREMTLAAIRAGWLGAGSALPSSRELAEQLGVARNTVLLAYQHLVDDELVESRERSGYFVRRGSVIGRRTEAATPSAAPVDWRRLLTIRPSEQRNIAKPQDWLDYPYPFLYGQFDPALFPLQAWRECARQALGLLAVRGWGPDLIDGDDPELVEQIRTRLLPRRGIWAPAEEVMVTLGAQQALYMLAELLIRPDTVVGVEDPGYPDARNIFRLKTAELRGLRVDHAGVIPEAIPEDCRLLYLTPSRQCPTGARLPLERRRQILALAEARDMILIEDDYESNFGVVSEPLPMLRSLDQGGRVIYVGSLSKILAPGLRAGYVVAAPGLLREARALRRLMLRHAPSNNQRALALFMALGHLDGLLRKVAEAVQERSDALQAALARHLPELTYSRGSGRSCFWVRGTGGLDSGALGERARAAGILIEPGHVFFMSEQPPTEYFRLGFSAIPTGHIEPGIRLLAQLVHASG